MSSDYFLRHTPYAAFTIVLGQGEATRKGIRRRQQRENVETKVHIYADNVAVFTGIDRTVGTDKDGHEWVHEDQCTDTHKPADSGAAWLRGDSFILMFARCRPAQTRG
jgi:hypothetical protein